MRVRSVSLIITLALIAAAPATAATPVLGPADGVQATRSGVALTVRFTGDSAQRAGVVGKEVVAVCGRHPGPSALAFDQGDDSVFAKPGTVAADGTAQLRLERDVAVDSCELTSSSAYAIVARVALTPAGEAWVDETIRATALHALLDRARGTGAAYRPLAALGAGVVALDGPDGAPAAGQTGYWTDGTRATVATVSAAGRRLAIEDRGHGVLRTDVFDQSDPFAALTDDIAGGDVAAGEDDGKHLPEDDGSRSPYRGTSPLRARDGIVAASYDRGVGVRFGGRSARTLRALAGRKVMAVCFARPAPAVFPAATALSRHHQAWTRVPRRGGAVRFTFAKAPGDVCVLVDDGTSIALVPVTKTGRTWLQDIDALGLIAGGADDIDRFAPSGATSYWPTATVVAHGRKALVAMPSPGAPVAVGRVGVWTDGARQAAEATTSASGRRFLLVDEGDGTLRTNIFGELNLWALLLLS